MISMVLQTVCKHGWQPLLMDAHTLNTTPVAAVLMQLKRGF